ncbi:hypothetical protein HOLleu_44391 [Holothuria leucospilota]|uniref:CCHC-type domain-containing protein n=1 Tax=Holothuria leucospilota TaxID=206669 RepID=A0A9Q0Y8W5_HOLLE|nr:hypothetical protein HOLleu_44391 [Holothuria leucospilota]
MRWVTYNEGELKGILNGKRQFRMVLKREIPSFLFIGGSKAHIRYFGQPRRCGRCWQVGHDKAECPNERDEDVGQAPEPSQLGPKYSTQELEEVAHEVEQDFLASKQCEAGTVTPEADSPPSLPTEPREAAIMTVEEDLHLSSESVSVMSDDDDDEPPPKDPPSDQYRAQGLKRSSPSKSC